MKSNSRSERPPLFLNTGRPRIILFAAVVLVFCLGGRPAISESAVTLAGMSRTLASDNTATTWVPDVFRGYSFLGMRKEAAAYLERKIYLAGISREEAIPLFEEIVKEQGRWEDPESLIAICEAAIRNGAGTPLVLYSLGTGMRLSGRLAEASAIFARISKESSYYPYALFALGQIAAEEGRMETAQGMFERVREIIRERGEGSFPEARVTRSEAELLLTLGRPGEAGPLFVSLLRDGENTLARIGWAAVDNGVRVGNRVVSPDSIADWPVKKQILLSLLEGGIFRGRGQFADAVSHFNWAEEKIVSSLGLSTPPATENYNLIEPVELIHRQVENHRSLRSRIGSSRPATGQEGTREQIVELLIELLFIDHSIMWAEQSMPRLPTVSKVEYLSRSQIEKIIRMIEEVSLGGIEVDKLVEGLTKKVDILQNLAHPIDRYRFLTRLEKSQEEIYAIKRRIHERREAAVAGLRVTSGVSISHLLEDMGKFLLELDAIREATGGLRVFTDRYFNILLFKKKTAEPSQESNEGMVRKALAIDMEGFRFLLPAVKALEEKARFVFWERKKQEIAALRPVVTRQIIDTLVRQARMLRVQKMLDGKQEVWSVLERAVSYLRGDALSGRDRMESALQVGSFLEEEEGRWEPYPGRVSGKREKEAIASVLPILEDLADSGKAREEAAYLLVSLKTLTNDPGARLAAEKFLREFPSSPFAGRIALRLGHDALLAGRVFDAEALYRKAAEGPEPEVGDVARYMLAWFRFQVGDAAGAAKEISRQLSDPAFRCGDPSSFEQAVLALAVRAWRERPLEELRSYPPIRDRVCGGRLLLLALGKDEKNRGESGRSAVIYEMLAERFVDEDEALAYEKKSVDSLLRAGMEDQAFIRIFQLEEKYGPGSEWAESRTPQVHERAREELVGMLKSISERKFDEGIRSGDRNAMAAAKTGLERFFSVHGGDQTGEDAELRLKWAIASLKAGDREGGMTILKEMAERKDDPVGEKAAVLYAETRIAAFERKEDTAEDVEEAAHLLLAYYPSEKAARLAYRAAAAFLSAENYDRAKRIAEEIEKNEATPKPILTDARLIYAESAIFTDDLAAARETAKLVLENSVNEGKSDIQDRARNLFVLASLKDIESRTDGEDWTGAARMLEDLGRRFPEADEAPEYFLRAFRSYRMGGDREAATEVGLQFLDMYPKRKEVLEIAGVVGAYLVEQGESRKAADLYARVSERFPKSEEGPEFLFLAARLTDKSGDPEEAAKRFLSYREKYPDPRWKSVYATLSVGLFSWKRGDVKKALRELEGGIRQLDAGVEEDAPGDLWNLGGRARIVIGEYWAEQFRKLELVVPLERNLAIKNRFFQKALEMFEKAMEESPPEVSIDASQRMGDLFVEFGKSILDSQRPEVLTGEERSAYEEGLKERARGFFQKGLEWYVEAFDRLEAEKGPADLAMSIRERIEVAQNLFAEAGAPQEAR